MKSIRPVKKLGVGLLVVMIWLELCMAYSSSCHHHLHHPLLQWVPANPGSPGKWPLKRREREREREIWKIGWLSKLNKTKGSSRSSYSAHLPLLLTFSFYHYLCSDDSDTSGVNLVCKISSWPMRDVTNTIEWLRERTEHLDIFLFSAHHSIVFYFRCSVYWWKGSVRF